MRPSKLLCWLTLLPLPLAAAQTPAPATDGRETAIALRELRDHVLGGLVLDGPEIAARKATIEQGAALFGTRASVIRAAFDLVRAYDDTIGPLWVDGSPIQQFDRQAVSDEDIHWVVYTVMQTLMDETYTGASLAAHQKLLSGSRFGSAAHFPGHVDGSLAAPRSVLIDASYPDTFGWNRQGDDLPARKPTGAYLAPGSMATVTVPQELVDSGYQIRVGAHSWDLETSDAGKPRRWVRRLDRSTVLYDVTSNQVQVASPLGGGIYLEVPFLADGGIVSIDVSGAVPAPYFSAKSFHTTTLAEWQDVERNHPAPWTDFQTEKFMMQVPTDWVYALDDPVTLMANWDLAVDHMNDLMGFPRDRGKETMYLQVDVILRGSAYYPGYPTGNMTYDPDADYGGLANNHLTRGPQLAPSYVFHEQGHAYFFKKFDGETESHVNLHHAAVWDQAFGFDLDTAFAASRDFEDNPHRTLANTAVAWMTGFNFEDGLPMEQLEKQYQLKGHAKFVDVARLFGWQAMNDYHHQLVVDGVRNNSGWVTDDDLIVRLALATGVDVRPLLHFWGVPPQDPAAVASAIAAANLPESDGIHDLLLLYRVLIPEDNAGFRDFAFGWWDGQPSLDGHQTESEHAQRWDTYDPSTHDAITAQLDAILALYFPNGDPEPDPGPPTLDSFSNDVGGGPVEEYDRVVYALTFSEGMTPATVDATDFENGATSAVTIDGVQTTADPAVFSVTVTPTEPGALQLQVRAGALLEDLAGEPLDTTAPITDPTVIAVDPGPNLAGELGILDVDANGRINPATGEPWQAGDRYRFAFVSSATLSADAHDLSTYDVFLQGLADAAGIGGTWRVIGSSGTVDARDHTGTHPIADPGVAVFLLDGSTVVADDYADLWDGTLDDLITRDEVGQTGISVDVATGSNADGTKRDRHLGGSDETPVSKIEYGASANPDNGRWCLIFNGAASSSYPYYALSDPLTVVEVP